MKKLTMSAGQPFPAITVSRFGGGTLNLGTPSKDLDWHLIVVYRGKHCPLCTNYLKALNELLPQFNELGVDVVAVSADSQERAEIQLKEAQPNYDVGFDLSIEQMTQLGLYISQPRSPSESDRPFAEPGLFVVNHAGELQIIDISNAPFARPELNSILMGLRFIRNPDNNYPIRGTHQ